MIAQPDFSSSQSHQPAADDGNDRASRSAASRREAFHDAGLVRRFNAGDDTAFAEIVSRYRERMFSVAFALLKNRNDAEEIAQDTFIRAHRGLAAFRGDSSLITWLHCITVNLARNRYWYFFRRRRHLTLSLDRPLSEDNLATFSDLVASDSASPAREAVIGEFSELVVTCMARLTEGQRTILTLRVFSHHSYGEIARELAISVGTVKSRIARARESLRILLAEACPEFSPEARPAAWFDHVRTAGGVQAVCA